MQGLLELIASLSDEDRRTLTAFAEFLSQRNGQNQANADVNAASAGYEQLDEMLRAQAQAEKQALQKTEEIPGPVDVPKQENETVIIALRRLSATYPMLDKRTLFSKTSDLVSQAFMGLKDHGETIESLEAIFAEVYEEFVKEMKQ